MDWCECCATRRGRDYVTGGRYAATLCPTCKGAGHSLGQCVLCGTFVWHCARVHHVGNAHPGTMARLVHDPFRELTQPKPSQWKLGTLRFDDATSHVFGEDD